MTTLGALKAEIALEIARTDLTTGIANTIAAAIRHYRRTRFYFNVSESVDLPTVASQSRYTASDLAAIPNISQIDAVFRVEADGTTPLTRAQPADMELALAANISAGKPCSYAYANRALRLSPKPNGIYTIRIFGHIWIDGPEDDDETDNPWMTEAYDLIKYRAKSSLYADYMEEDGMGMAQAMASAESEQLNALIGETAMRDMTGFIEPTQF